MSTSGFEDGKSPGSPGRYDHLAMIIPTPTALNRDEISGAYSVDLVAPEYEADESGLIAPTGGCNRTSPPVRHDRTTRISA